MNKISVYYGFNSNYQFNWFKLSLQTLIKSQNIKNISFYILVNDEELAQKVKNLFREHKLMNFETKLIQEQNVNHKIFDNPHIWWIWAPFIFDFDTEYMLQLDNDTLVNLNFDFINEAMGDDKNDVFIGTQYGKWSKKFYQNTHMMKSFHKNKAEREKAVENFCNTGVILINLKNYRENIKLDSLNRNYELFYKKAFISYFFRKWIRTNDELFLLTFYSNTLSKRMPRKFNICIHATHPTWVIEESGDWILHILGKWKKEVLDIIHSNNESHQIAIGTLKNKYVKHWRKAKLCGELYKFDDKTIDQSFKKIIKYLEELKK